MLTFNKPADLFRKEGELNKSHLNASSWSIQIYPTQKDDDEAKQLFKHLLENASNGVSAKPLDKNAESEGKLTSAFVAEQEERRQQKSKRQSARQARTPATAPTTSVDYRSHVVGAFKLKRSSF